MSNWQESWAAVEQAVKSSETRGEAVARVAAVLGRGITWDGLQRSYKRYAERSILEDLGTDGHPNQARELIDSVVRDAQQRSEPSTPPWHTKPRVYNQPRPLRILVIPDTQVMAGVPLSHFTALGRYAVAKRPDVLIHLGDFRDFPSLSSYDSMVKKAMRGSCKLDDIDAGNRALDLLETELAKAQGYSPKKIMLMGNHDCWGEHGRVGRYLAEHPDDRRLLERVELLEHECGWEVVPFLEPVEVQGTLYCHLFPFSAKGTVTGGSMRMGASSASAQVKAVMQSCTAGHKQGLDVAIQNTPVNTHRGLIAGSFYQHTDSYMPGARFWRGCLMKTEAVDGQYGLVEISLDYLLRRYL